MDMLTKEARDHGQIFESIAFFKQSLSTISGEDEAFLGKVRSFLRDSVRAHFVYEEKNLFDFVLSKGTLKEKMFIRDLQVAHINILMETDVAEDMLSRQERGEPIKPAEIRAAVKKIISLMLKHARMEDARLFSIVEKYQ